MNKIITHLIACGIGIILGLYYNPDPKVIDNTENNIKAHRIEINRLQNEINGYNVEIEYFKAEIDTLNNEIESLEGDKAKIIKRYEKRISDISNYTPNQLDSALTARYK